MTNGEGELSIGFFVFGGGRRGTIFRFFCGERKEFRVQIFLYLRLHSFIGISKCI